MIAKIKSSLDIVKDTYQVFYLALIGAGLLHAVFFIVFSWLGIQALMAFNFFSCALYFVCTRLFIHSTQSEDYRLVALIASTEVVAHAYLSSYYIGLDSGFHYYILILTLVPMINDGIAIKENFLRILILILSYVGLFVWLNGRTPIVALDEDLLLSMRLVNVVILMLGVGAVSLKILSIILKEKARLSDLAKTDKLTGLYNRHGFMALVEREVNNEIKQIDALSILVLDVDLFKEVNDQYGHQCGDYVLSKLAEVMRKSLRKHEMIARWGGDEFIVLLPDTDKDELAVLAERLRSEVAQTTFNYQNHEIFISVSIGGTTYQPGDSFETLTSRADKALYQGKDSGGNSFNTVHA